MKKLLFLLIFVPSVAYAYCVNTSSGYVYINGHRINFTRYGARGYIETTCTTRRRGWILWRGGRVCTGGYIWYRNADGRHGWCKVRNIRRG